MSQAYYQLLVDRLSGHIADRRSRRLAWVGDRYRKLAQINRLIVEVRERIKRQKVQIRALQLEERSTRRATALLRRLEMTLHLMNGHRTVILQKVRADGSAPRRALAEDEQWSVASSR
ncbi:MAG TPA: hypothetical protein VFI48_05020 [Hyphomicrobiaceae bacterium]|nr:hypothetical protein [Hyphomicrobiaceae bacterium]